MRVHLKPLLIAYAVLLALLALTVGLAFVPLGRLAPISHLAIAAAMIGLIAWHHMHLHDSAPFTRIAAALGVLWLPILLFLGILDWMTR